ncbi:hypothetical protein Q7P37_010170 [Cladosporium fusiforme]
MSSGSNFITTTVTKTSISPTASLDVSGSNRGSPPSGFGDRHFDSNDQSTGPKRRRMGEDWPHRRDDDDHVDDGDEDGDKDADDDDDGDEDDKKPDTEKPDTYLTLEKYPYLIKIEERRVPGAENPPYCQQFQLLNNGQLEAVVNPDDGNEIIFAFDESPPEYYAYDRETSVDERSVLKRGTPSDGCHCQWWSE